MRHDWIFDVLADLRAYADENNLPALAAQVTATLRVADIEVAEEAFARAQHAPAGAKDKGKHARRAH
ncbi:hypothetical protein [Pseudorhodobacter ferrugineus]|uniref:hypothetical protein n=1 Tax=Pseudorhodobacter ferrugineus TaxID=77008 RepID=UPI0003B4F709|nr:hypothetical protein [Pseudorhodobacter ferrugineus]